MLAAHNIQRRSGLLPDSSGCWSLNNSYIKPPQLGLRGCHGNQQLPRKLNGTIRQSPSRRRPLQIGVVRLRLHGFREHVIMKDGYASSLGLPVGGVMCTGVFAIERSWMAAVSCRHFAEAAQAATLTLCVMINSFLADHVGERASWTGGLLRWR